MKRVLISILFLLGFFFSDLRAQTVIPNGKAKLIVFTNDSASFIVPDGKAWYIVNVFSTSGFSPAYVFLKSINGRELTTRNATQTYLKLFDPNYEKTHPLPLVLPSNTKFELMIMKTTMISYELSEKSAFMTIVEVEN